MTALSTTRVAPARARPTLRRLPAIIGGIAALVPIAAMLGLRAPAWVLLAIAAGLLAAESVRQLFAVGRNGGFTGLALAGMVSLVVLVMSVLGTRVGGVDFGWTIALLAAGLVCLAVGVSGLRVARDQSPWERLSQPGGREVGVAATQAMMALFGVILLLLAAYLSLGLWFRLEGTYPFVSMILFVGGVFVVAVVAVVVWVVRRVVAHGPSAPPRDEQVVAAHLHDSVLQTLSLIQRSASDPAKVSQLARQQERSLRDWLAGRDDTSGQALAGAVRLAAQEVEDEQPGAVIEVVAVGDAPLDREADAMVRAAREAMRNAARHAGSPVRVFVEVEDGVRELFVRDTGAGFDLATVGEERRGVRDAIIGRMEHVGGTATIDSSASGTEIALRLPAPAEGALR